ncbi:hypothetical protein J5N97_004740 [Dioscorea zingiberensis]|uniref:Uncharacterized protein n=1 Tax=Dioscorea zingiberensis TaxID=325984 RepID=A0A9D5D7V1_9LILI|nr:hypothetical protein J5N97_004740 [Dioscorea zingiberensis]
MQLSLPLNGTHSWCFNGYDLEKIHLAQRQLHEEKSYRGRCCTWSTRWCWLAWVAGRWQLLRKIYIDDGRQEEVLMVVVWQGPDLQELILIGVGPAMMSAWYLLDLLAPLHRMKLGYHCSTNK